MLRLSSAFRAGAVRLMVWGGQYWENWGDYLSLMDEIGGETDPFAEDDIAEEVIQKNTSIYYQLMDGAIYDPVQNTWSPLKGTKGPFPSPEKAISFHSGMFLFNGQYKADDDLSASMVTVPFYFDPATSSWVNAGFFPPSKYSFGQGILAFEGGVIVWGGTDSDHAPGLHPGLRDVDSSGVFKVTNKGCIFSPGKFRK